MWSPDNGIGGVGWQAIAAALRPRETPDGGWVCNITVKDLRLGGAPPAPALLAHLASGCGGLADTATPCCHPKEFIGNLDFLRISSLLLGQNLWDQNIVITNDEECPIIFSSAGCPC